MAHPDYPDSPVLRLPPGGKPPAGVKTFPMPVAKMRVTWFDDRGNPLCWTEYDGSDVQRGNTVQLDLVPEFWLV